jgi:hypothetical protein
MRKQRGLAVAGVFVYGVIGFVSGSGMSLIGGAVDGDEHFKWTHVKRHIINGLVWGSFLGTLPVSSVAVVATHLFLSSPKHTVVPMEFLDEDTDDHNGCRRI